MTEIEIATIHEAAHAVMALSLGHIPTSVSVDSSGGGEVAFIGLNDPRSALLIGMAGDVASEMLCGVAYTASDEDHELMKPHWDALMCSGRPQQIRQAIESEVWERVATLQEPIISMANILLDRGSLDRHDLGLVCQRVPELSMFAHLFPAPTVDSMIRAKARHGRSVARGRSHNALPPGFSFRLVDG